MALVRDKKYYKDLANKVEKQYNLPSNLLVNLLQAESSYNPDVISGKKKSSSGAIGIAQFMPSTAKEYGIDPTNPEQSIEAAAKYLKKSYNIFGNWEDSVRSYNTGVGNVKAWKKGKKKLAQETINYTNKIFGGGNIGKPEQSIEVAAEHLKRSYDIFGKWEDSLRSYNAGVGNVKLAQGTTNYTNENPENGNVTSQNSQSPIEVQTTETQIKEPKIPNIYTDVTNFGMTPQINTFVPQSQEDTTQQEESKKTEEEKVVEQKTNELNLIKDFYQGRIQQPQFQQEDLQQQELPRLDVMQQYAEISNLLDQGREGGFFEGWAFNTMQTGGEIKTTPYGQWEFPGEITKIPSNQITMKDVPQALLGISDIGEKRIMLPEEEHTFQNATEVTEVPLSFKELYKLKTGKDLK